MSAVRLDISMERLKKCYIGKDDDGKHVLDKSKVDELSFLFALTRVKLAIENGEMTEDGFIEELTKKDEE